VNLLEAWPWRKTVCIGLVFCLDGTFPTERLDPKWDELSVRFVLVAHTRN
jgi:hypothetical protein